MRLTKFCKRKILCLFVVITIMIFSFLPFNLFTQASNKEKVYLVPLGNVIGIRLDTKGVLVIGIEESNSGFKNKGLRVGDIIEEVESKKVNKAVEIEKILNDEKKNSVDVKILRNGGYIEKKINVEKDTKNEKYKMGVWVRDKIVGIGTLTYYNPENKKFAALGHGITDVDTGELIHVKKGNLYIPSSVDIKKGTCGVPGEIIGEFNHDIIGSFEKNDLFGINGHIEVTKNLNICKPMEVAHYYEVKKGKAYLLFPDKNNIIKRYEVEIKKIYSQDNPESKSMLVEIVDPELLKYTGGIVQGMSGAPIIQDEKIIGAITHVFVNDPKKGYAIFIDWMIK